MANIHSLFYEMQAYFKAQEKAEHFARISLGPSCEQWINGEIFCFLNWGSGITENTSEIAEGEKGKRDISILDPETEKISHIIEVKVVYNVNASHIKSRLKKLKKQLQAAKTRHPNVSVTGFVFCVCHEKCEEEVAFSSKDFLNQVTETMSELMPRTEGTCFTTPHKYRPETIFKLAQVEWNREKFEISCHSLYVTHM